MGATKYPVLDPAFKLKMLGACTTEEDRGLIAILWLTGMHPCIISKDPDANGNERPRPEIVREGPNTYLYWKRAKTGKRLREAIPKDLQPSIEAFLKAPPKCLRYNYDRIKAIGTRAGYEGVSAATLRHSRCLRGLTVEGYTIYEMPSKMGCTLDVVVRNYAALKDSQMQGRPSTTGPERPRDPADAPTHLPENIPVERVEISPGRYVVTYPEEASSGTASPRTRAGKRKRSFFDRLRRLS